MEKYKGLCVPHERREGSLEDLWVLVQENREAICYGCFDCDNLSCKRCIFSSVNYERRYEYLKSIFEKNMKKYKGLDVPTARRPDTLKALWGIVKDNREALCYGSFDCGESGCEDCVFSKQNCELRYEYLKSIFEEEGEKKMFAYKLCPGDIVETVSGEFYMYVADDKIYHLITVKSDIVLTSPCCRLTELADEITNVYNPDYIPDIYQVIHDIEDARNQFNVWTKEACLELTMEELEQRLGIKVKIVKEHK